MDYGVMTDDCELIWKEYIDDRMMLSVKCMIHQLYKNYALHNWSRRIIEQLLKFQRSHVHKRTME